jgi:hypothetical protein
MRRQLPRPLGRLQKKTASLKRSGRCGCRAYVEDMYLRQRWLYCAEPPETRVRELQADFRPNLTAQRLTPKPLARKIRPASWCEIPSGSPIWAMGER